MVKVRGQMNEGLRRWGWVAIIGLALMTSACGSKGGGKANQQTTSAAIGAAGGSLSSADGKLTLTIPAGALGNTETITIESVDPSALPSEFSGGNSLAAYKLGPDGTRFSQPIEISAKLDEQPV